jgi:hypothetical protein
MSKAKKPVQPAEQNKGFLKLAGEALSVLGGDIVESKDKVVEVAAEKFTVFREAVGKIVHKKKPAKPAKKTAAGKKQAKASVKKSTKKKQPAKGTTKAASGAKVSKSVTASKKTVKKTAGKTAKAKK